MTDDELYDFDWTPRTTLPAWLADASPVIGRPQAAAAAKPVIGRPQVDRPAARHGKLARREAAGQFAFDFAA